MEIFCSSSLNAGKLKRKHSQDSRLSVKGGGVMVMNMFIMLIWGCNLRAVIQMGLLFCWLSLM